MQRKVHISSHTALHNVPFLTKSTCFVTFSHVFVWPFQHKGIPLHPEKHRGVEQLVARQAHNLEVARSSRTPATDARVSAKEKASSSGLVLFSLPSEKDEDEVNQRTSECKRKSIKFRQPGAFFCVINPRLSFFCSTLYNKRSRRWRISPRTFPLSFESPGTQSPASSPQKRL